MNKLIGFLQWQFKGALKSAQLYAFGLVLLAVAAKLGGCPAPIPMYITIAGIVLGIGDTIVWFVKFQYLLYRQEQDRIARELSRK